MMKGMMFETLDKGIYICHSDSLKDYYCDIENHTCTCKAWLCGNRPCRHLKVLGIKERNTKTEENTMEVKEEQVNLDGWQELKSSGQYWEPQNKGDSLEGQVTEVRQGLFGQQWVIKTAKNEDMITPSHKVLQARMSQVNVKDTVRIVYDGTLPPQVRGQNETRMYKVFRKQ